MLNMFAVSTYHLSLIVFEIKDEKYAAHFCNLKLTFISYSFWNIRRKVLKFYKFDEKKGNDSKMGNQIYFKIPG
jgi:hypothetical protein